MLKLLLAFSLFAAALTPATHDLVVYDTTTGKVVMVVILDYEEQIADPAYNQPGTAQIITDKSVYVSGGLQAMLALAPQKVKDANPPPPPPRAYVPDNLDMPPQ